MRFFAILLALTSVILFSCQKELDSGNGGNGGGGGIGGGGGSSELLIRTVAKTGSDSVVTLYSYNANKRISNIKMNGIDETGSPVNREYRYYRTGTGILTQYSIIDADLVAVGIDSIVTIVHYNSTSSKYSSYVLRASAFGFTLLDSSVFVYDAAGKIIREDVYESPTGSGTDYYLSGKANYTYIGNNISQLDLHDFDVSGAETFWATNKFTYDTKLSPLHFDNESFAMGHAEWFSVNNIIGEQLSDSNGPVDDQTVTTVYTYNPSTKPKSSVITITPPTSTSNMSYYYQ